jgi:hypothetical protein
MKWKLTVDIDLDPTFRPMRHGDPVISLGSCFSAHMAARLAKYHWKISDNAFGILYNPLSIATALEAVIARSCYGEDELVRHSGRFVSMDHHGEYSGPDAAGVVMRINDSISEAHGYLGRNTTVLITFGTAFYYVYKQTGRVAGNCHKIGAGEFDRLMADSPSITRVYRDLFTMLSEKYPGIQFLLAVSPVRHWKDGAADNNWSKSVLVCAVRELTAAFDNVYYFPSFEIMMDELRDYRFYAEDLLHPSDQAVDYIWERFSEACIAAPAREIHDEIAAINSRLEHRPLHPDSDEHQRFLEETAHRIGILKKKYPHIDL